VGSLKQTKTNRSEHDKDDTAWQLFSGHDTVHSILEARNLRKHSKWTFAEVPSVWGVRQGAATLMRVVSLNMGQLLIIHNI
jgi:hypothetical protein